MHLCPINFFPFRFSHELLLELVEKTKQLYVLPTLIKCYSTTSSFELWMSKAKHDDFALVIKFLGVD
jgi:hypothetical protein